MKISSSFNYKQGYKTQESFKGFPPTYKKIPEVIGNLGKLAGEYVHAPEQKLFLATTALMLVPLIDLKFAEEDKKVDTAIKSASKTIAGGITGVSIRAGCVALAKSLIGFEPHKTSKVNMHLLPKAAIEMYNINPAKAKVRLNSYIETLGTLAAIAIMVGFTNAKVDVPLTSDMQDLLSGVIKQDKSWLQSFTDVKNNRVAKIKKWANKWKSRFDFAGDKIIKAGQILTEPPKKQTEADK